MHLLLAARLTHCSSTHKEIREILADEEDDVEEDGNNIAVKTSKQEIKQSMEVPNNFVISTLNDEIRASSCR